jgi:xanthosine utilization system XapX-like protein
MMQHDFSEYAALWREQIDPRELAGLQSMAAKIKRSAARKWLLDCVLGIAVVGVVCEALLRWPAPPLIKLCMALLLTPVLYFWRRERQLTKAARAIAVDDPRVFFEAAIENMRAEIKLFTLSAWLAMPAFAAFSLLLGASYGFDFLYTNLVSILTLASPKSAAIAALAVLSHIYIFRENNRRREQLRRLEAMRREWEERDPGGEP